MTSNVLPQALCTIPRNPKLCHPKTLGFSAFVSRRPSPLDSARLSTSCVTVNAFGPSLDPVILAKTSSNRSFIVRAESNPEGEGTIENAEENEAVDSEASEAEAGVATKDAAVVKEPRKPRIKLGDIMGILNKRAVEASDNIRPIPDLRTGDIIEIKMRVQETKRRLSVYKGIIIGRQNAGIHTTIRVRRIIAGVGVEIVFPIYSPLIKEIKVIKHRKVRRAKLYYLRDKLPRFCTFK
ncbi:large ribosomal subunit protein bL19cz-like [Rhododendron vialii]|uniref:large ribosomal subunit protein bL19cz-like n=1 Tax=Rhododendron vialii TaxID=182163 RepID=UPI00265F5359|nr:large ribosomal subunit protein bL19cz-like [Rhododendron vialii]